MDKIYIKLKKIEFQNTYYTIINKKITSLNTQYIIIFKPNFKIKNGIQQD